MSGTAEAVRHPALAPAAGAPLAAAALSDRARLAVVLQAAGALSLCEVAGWRLTCGFRAACVEDGGRLTGLEAAPGHDGAGAVPVLLTLLRGLFGAGQGIPGRGEARRAARTVAARWSAALDRLPADRAVDDLLAAAPFLLALPPARAALSGVLVRDGREIDWRAGRAPAVLPDADPAALLARARWSAAARAFGARPPVDDDGRLAFARALHGAGRAEAALALLGARRDAAAEILRAECQHLLGELAAATETVRRLAAAELDGGQLVAGGDVALRVLALAGEPALARDWAARAIAATRGTARLAARLLAVQAAGDRGDAVTLERRLADVAAAQHDPRLAPRWHEVQAEVCWARGDGEGLIHHAARCLALSRRHLRRDEAGRAWNRLGLGRSLAGRFAEAERAFAHAARLLRGCDGPLAVTLAGANLADVRLRLGRRQGIDALLTDSAAHNRRAGNERGAAVDGILAVRLELVRFELERALERAAKLAERLAGDGWAAERARLGALAARALGWLGRAAEARAALGAAGPDCLGELEPEEAPFLLALAGDNDRALAAARGEHALLATSLVRGEAPSPAQWRGLDRLEPYRRARFLLDAELVAPGLVPGERRREGAAIFRRLGIARAAERLERAGTVAWRALADYFERPATDRGALEKLLAAVGHSEAEIVLRCGEVERRLAGAGGRSLAAERAAQLGESELILRAAELDDPLRALFALLLRELPAAAPAPARTAAGGFDGDSPALLAALERLRRFAVSDLPVLVLGENGTGKELAAREVHRASGRGGALVPLNCAGLPESLLLAELFGHARGAFTGADRERAGIFEAARGGTAFLDEIGDLPASAQGSLLRVLQEKEVRRLGESLPRRVDVRFVAATNRDLETLVEEGKFRQDLYFRLKAATVVLPPLRERGGDVLALAERFLERLRARQPGLRLSPEARRALLAHGWPGNVRELKNVLEAAAALAPAGRIEREHLDLGGAAPPAKGARPGDYHAELDACRRRLIERALEESAGSLAGAARSLGVSRQYLSQYVRKYDLKIR